jgi:hypothetical protein
VSISLLVDDEMLYPNGIRIRPCLDRLVLRYILFLNMITV